MIQRERRQAFILLAVLIAALLFAGRLDKASASTGCATQIDFFRVVDGLTPAKVSSLLHQRGMVLGKGPLLLAKRYRACNGTHRIYVEFKRSRQSVPRRAYSELWGY